MRGYRKGAETGRDWKGLEGTGRDWKGLEGTGKLEAEMNEKVAAVRWNSLAVPEILLRVPGQNCYACGVRQVIACLHPPNLDVPGNAFRARNHTEARASEFE